MNTIASPEEPAVRHQTLVLHVRYLAASKPYVNDKASASETLAELKPIVLNFFGLKEGEVDGGQKVYEFSAHHQIQTDLSVTLGSLAEGKHHLELKLIERFIQG